jgi:hypothetical protein
MSEHDHPIRGEATGDEHAIEDPTRESSTGLEDQMRTHSRRGPGKPRESEDPPNLARRDEP